MVEAGHRSSARLAAQLGCVQLAQFPQVVQIRQAKHQPCPRSVLPDRLDMGQHRDVANQIDQLEFVAPLLQELLNRERERGINGFNASALELVGVPPQPGQVGGQEGHFPAQFLQQAHLSEGGMAARIPIRPGRRMVNHQDPAHHPAVLVPFGGLSGGRA